MSPDIFVSCIIATKNEEKNLPRLLKSIKEQRYQNLEIIVVDNSSKDKTKEIAKNFGAKVFDHGPERSPQRNFGVEKSKGNYLLFLDADMELEKSLLQECVELIELDNRLKALIIPEKSVGEGFWAKAKALERQTYLGDSSIEAARFFERKAFLQVGGYDESLIAAEDWDLHSRIKDGGFKIGRINSFIIHHEGNLKFSTSLSKKFYYGKNLSKFLEKGNFKAGQVSPIRLSYIKNLPLFLKHPVTTIGFAVLKFSELSALALGVLLTKFKLTR